MAIVKDLSGNNANGSFVEPELVLSDKGLLFNEEGKVFRSGAFTISSAITVEQWVTTNLSSRVINLIGDMVTLTVTDGIEWRFSFRDGGTYRGRLRIEPGKKYYIALSHTFGNSASTIIAVNGRKVSGSWISGTGNEALTMTNYFISVALGKGDILHQLKISDTAKTLAYVKQYFGGAA